MHNGRVYTQLQRCEGTVSDMVTAAGGAPLPEATVRAVLRDMLSALVVCHGAGVAHMDVRPDNMHCANGVYKLGGFELVSVLGEALPPVLDARYAAPELLEPSTTAAAALAAADMFSLGVSVCEAASGRLTAPATPAAQTFTDSVTPAAGMSAGLNTLLRRMVQRNRARRPSAKEALAWLAGMEATEIALLALGSPASQAGAGAGAGAAGEALTTNTPPGAGASQVGDVDGRTSLTAVASRNAWHAPGGGEP